MKFSTAAATGAGALTAFVGIGCAFLCPLAGLGLGAYLTFGAAAGAGFATGATVALTAAGAVGGLVIGRIAAPIVAVASLGIGLGVAATVKLFGSLFDRLGTRGKSEPAPERALSIETQTSFKSQMKLAASFAGLKKSAANGNASAQKKQRAPGFKL
jgi:hypothetical protein